MEDFCSGYSLSSCLPSGLWPGGSQGAVAEEVGARMPDTSEPDTAAAGSRTLPFLCGEGAGGAEHTNLAAGPPLSGLNPLPYLT